MRKIGNGSLRLPINSKQYFTVWGGPYRQRPTNMVGVKLAREIPAACDLDLPIRDFCVPDLVDLNEVVRVSVVRILAGEPLYAGCMGGQGRTGLFLSILAKAFGVVNPVEYVREHYYPHAVETSDQYKFVQRYEVTATVAELINQFKRRNWWKFWKRQFTVLPKEEKCEFGGKHPAHRCNCNPEGEGL